MDFWVLAIFGASVLALAFVFAMIYAEWLANRNKNDKRKWAIIPTIISILIGLIVVIHLLSFSNIHENYYDIDVNKAAEKYEEMIPVKEASEKYNSTIFEVYNDDSSYFSLILNTDEGKLEFLISRATILNMQTRGYIKETNVIEFGKYNVTAKAPSYIVLSRNEAEMLDFIVNNQINTIEVKENGEDTVRILARVKSNKEDNTTFTEYTFVIDAKTVSELIFDGVFETVKTETRR